MSYVEPVIFDDQVEKMYKSWVEHKIRTSTDEVFRFALGFMAMMQQHRLFRYSIRAGDGIMIEKLYMSFLPVWASLRKNIYVEILYRGVMIIMAGYHTGYCRGVVHLSGFMIMILIHNH